MTTEHARRTKILATLGPADRALIEPPVSGPAPEGPSRPVVDAEAGELRSGKRRHDNGT